MTDNPYQAPETKISGATSENIEKVARGQHLLIYGILIYFGAIAGQFIIGPLAGLLLLGTLVYGILGIVNLATGFGYSVVKVVLLCISMFIPLVGLIILLILNSKATKELRASGYKVGLLGASKNKVV